MGEHERDESSLERLDRNELELLNELRVASAGVQVLLGFLLIVPFNNRFTRLSSFERYDYFVTLVCMATAATLLIAPSIQHRVLFRRSQKAFLVAVGNRAAITAMVFMTVGMTGILMLIADVVFGGAVTVVVGVLAAVVVSGVWFGVPLNRLRKL
jgi:O-antigen/teichoic acid export membrane protein